MLHILIVRMSRYVQLIRQLRKPSLDDMKRKFRDFPKKYVLIPAARGDYWEHLVFIEKKNYIFIKFSALYFTVSNLIPITIVTGLLMIASELKANNDARRQRTERKITNLTELNELMDSIGKMWWSWHFEDIFSIEVEFIKSIIQHPWSYSNIIWTFYMCWAPIKGKWKSFNFYLLCFFYFISAK